MKDSQKELLILGSGTSTGTPMVGCHCPVCTSKDSRDRRLRSSVLYRHPGVGQMLIDTGPDLRQQLLNAQIEHLDSVLITHDHADHLHGIDELRPLTFNPQKSPLKVWCSPVHKKPLEERFPYIFKRQEHFKGKAILGGGIPRLELFEVPLEEEFEIAPKLMARTFLMPHGHGQTLALVTPAFAYLIDCHDIPAKLLNFLQSNPPKLLILDCVQKKAHQTHLNVERAFEFITRIKPQKAGLIHMNHELSHQELTQMALESFGPGVFPLYDGQVLTIANL